MPRVIQSAPAKAAGIMAALAAGLGGRLMAAASQVEIKKVQLVVTVPDLNADQAERIYLATSRNGWNAKGPALPRVAPGVYSATLELAAGITLEYKITRAGDWRTVEKSPQGYEIPNRTLLVDPTLDEQIVVVRIGSWADRPVSGRRRVETSEPGQPFPQERPSTLTGDIRYHYLFHSPQLKNARTIMVYLPPGYDEHPKERYPVLYMHDGNNVFDAKTSFTGIEWGADEAAQRLIEEGRIRKIIIVAIYNTPNRVSEYTPFVDPQLDGGEGDKYLAFLVETLKPFIDKNYRTRRGREHTAIAGSSLGGLISLYAVYKHPKVFKRVAALSPSLMWADGAILEYVRQSNPRERPLLWLDMGTAEGSPDGPLAEYAQAIERCHELVKILINNGYTADKHFHFEQVEGGRHHESDWARRFDQVLLYLFGTDAD